MEITREQIEEGNNKIVKFLEYKLSDPILGLGYDKKYRFNPDKMLWDYCICGESELLFHSSWDWLMPVIDKITEVRHRIKGNLSGFPINVTIVGGGGTHIAINQGNCAGEEYNGDRVIVDTLNMNYFEVDEKMKYTSIQLAWFAVVKFIEWYNENKE